MPDGLPPVFGYLIDRTAKVIKSDLNRRFRNLKLDITAEQWLLLSKLAKKDGQPQVDLGDQTYKNAPTISRIIDLLVAKGLAERRGDWGDRRKFRIYITKKGREFVDKAYPEVIAARQEGWSKLSEEDYQMFTRVINTVFDNLSKSE